MTKSHLNSEGFSDNDWLERMYRKSESARTRQVAETSLKMFMLFSNSQGLSKEKMIQKYQAWYEQDKPDIRSICMSLDKFVQFLNEDNDIVLNQGLNTATTFKRKSPKTIALYFGFIKSYLRICHNVKISTDDIHDYIQFPKIRKEPRKAITIEQLKLIMNNASPKRKALYYTLVTSGMRLGEALTLTKKSFHLDENPVRITLDAENTKTKEGRETYITSEAYEKVKHLLDGKKDNDRIFTNEEDLAKSVSHEDQIFADLRKKLGMTEKYSNSVRSVVNLHSFRAYFHTKASQKHGVEYANALDGHGAYLKQYYRETDEERAKKYRELESSLFIESVKLETEKTKDKIIADLQANMEKLQDKMKLFELLQTH